MAGLYFVNPNESGQRSLAVSYPEDGHRRFNSGRVPRKGTFIWPEQHISSEDMRQLGWLWDPFNSCWTRYNIASGRHDLLLAPTRGPAAPTTSLSGGAAEAPQSTTPIEEEHEHHGSIRYLRHYVAGARISASCQAGLASDCREMGIVCPPDPTTPTEEQEQQIEEQEEPGQQSEQSLQREHAEQLRRALLKIATTTEDGPKPTKKQHRHRPDRRGMHYTAEEKAWLCALIDGDVSQKLTWSTIAARFNAKWASNEARASSSLTEPLRPKRTPQGLQDLCRGALKEVGQRRVKRRAELVEARKRLSEGGGDANAAYDGGDEEDMLA